jgi:hypothetical protein
MALFVVNGGLTGHDFFIYWRDLSSFLVSGYPIAPSYISSRPVSSSNVE